MPTPKVNNDYNDLYPEFREKVKAIVAEMNRWTAKHLPGYEAIMFEGFRTRERQMFLYDQGRTTGGKIVTNANGTTQPSNHQSALAADIIAKDPKGNPTWDLPQAFWDYLQHVAHTKNLTSGSDWKFVDPPHVEMPTILKSVYRDAAAWKKERGLT